MQIDLYHENLKNTNQNCLPSLNDYLLRINREIKKNSSKPKVRIRTAGRGRCPGSSQDPVPRLRGPHVLCVERLHLLEACASVEKAPKADRCEEVVTHLHP